MPGVLERGRTAGLDDDEGANRVEPDRVETDEQLMARWNSGRDQSARDALIGRYLPRFYGTARAMLLRVEEAEDIAQEVMLKVVVALDRFDGRSTFQAWSYAILLNTVRTSVRQGKLRGNGSIRWPMSSAWLPRKVRWTVDWLEKKPGRCWRLRCASFRRSKESRWF